MKGGRYPPISCLNSTWGKELKLLIVVVLVAFSAACSGSQGESVVGTNNGVSHVVCVDANNVVVDNSKCVATSTTTTTQNNGMPMWFWYHMYINSVNRPRIGTHVTGGSTYPRGPITPASEGIGVTSRSTERMPSSSRSLRPTAPVRPSTPSARPSYRAPYRTPSFSRPSRLMGGRR